MADFLSYDIETWKLFIQEHWLVLVIALIVLLIVVNVLKTVLKWALAAVIIIVVIIYSGYTLNDLNLDNLKSIGTQVADSVKGEVMDAMIGEADDAAYTDHGDGTFTVTTANLEITGRVGDPEVEVSFRGAPPVKWQVDDTIRSLIDQARRNG